MDLYVYLLPLILIFDIKCDIFSHSSYYRHQYLTHKLIVLLYAHICGQYSWP